MSKFDQVNQRLPSTQAGSMRHLCTGDFYKMSVSELALFAMQFTQTRNLLWNELAYDEHTV